MEYNATIEADGTRMAVVLNELSGVGSRQVADRGEVTSRLYTAYLDRETILSLWRPVWVEEDGRRFVAYPVMQKARVSRLLSRDGEFFPGLVLEHLGVLETPGPRPIASGEGWYLCSWGLNRYFTEDFSQYEVVPLLRDVTYSVVGYAGGDVILAVDESLMYSAEGKNWATVDIMGCGVIRALAWDGADVWVAASNGVYRVTWSSKTEEQAFAGDFCGFFHSPSTNVPILIKASDGGGYDVISAETGSTFFHTDTEADWRDNTLLWYPHFYTIDTARNLREFYALEERIVTTIPQRFEEGFLQMFRMRDVGLVLAEGCLCTFDRDELRHVYDFGDVVMATPSRRGPIVQRLSDGEVFRVRRI